MINSPHLWLFISFYVSCEKLVLHQDSILKLMFFHILVVCQLGNGWYCKEKLCNDYSSENNLSRQEMKVISDFLPLMREFVSKLLDRL